MKRSGLLVLALFIFCGINSSAFGIFEARNYAFDPPPYEVSIWGTGGLIFGTFKPLSGGDARYQFNPTNVNTLRFSYGFEFMFRLWIFGLGFEYSKQTLESIKLNPDLFKVSNQAEYANLTEIYTANQADAYALKLKLEFFNFIAETGIGFYTPQVALFEKYEYTTNGTAYKEIVTRTSVNSSEPQVFLCFGLGYPLLLSRDMDLTPYLRVNLFTSQTSISQQNLKNIERSTSASTVDLGLKLRIVFH